MIFGWLPQLFIDGASGLSAVVSTVLAVGVAFMFVAAGSQWLGRRVLLAPVRASWRGDPALRGSTIDMLLRSLDPGSSEDEARRPGRVLANLAAAQEVSGQRRWPWEVPDDRRWLEDTSSRLSDSLLARLMAPDSARTLSQLTSRLAHAIEDYLFLRVADVAVLRRKRVIADGLLFARAATALSGAVVLMDGVHTRAGSVGAVRVWHSAAHRPGSDRFGDHHALGSRRAAQHGCPYGERLRDSPSTLVGDFDGRVIDLRGVALVQDERREGSDFLLLTAETCYAATEVSGPGLPDLRCKGLKRADTDPTSGAGMLEWRFDPASAQVERTPTPTSRTSLVTGFASVVLQQWAANRCSASWSSPDVRG